MDFDKVQQLERNNTNFATELKKEYNKIIYNNGALKDFQKIILKYLRFIRVKSGGRGLLIAADPGMGKTRIAIAVAEEFLRNKTRGIDKVYMISQKSLHDNFDDNIKKYKAATGREIKPTYISLNASNFGEKIIDLNFENSVVIIDEAHKLASMVINGSEAGINFYMTLKNTKNIIVLFLTGTPIMNKAFEIVVYFNIIAGYDLLPENILEFEKYFGGGKNMSLMQNRIMGLSSFVHIDTTSDEFPTVMPIEEIYITMSNEEFRGYKIEAEREIKENALKFIRSKGRSGVRKSFEGVERSSSTYRVKTRQLCNCVAKIDWIVKYILDNSDKLGSVYSQFIGDGGIAKVTAALKNTGKYEEYDGTKSIDSLDKSKKYYICMTSEHSSEERTDLQAQFNKVENAETRLIHIVFCSAASTFGLHFNNVEFAIVLEPHWLYETLYQYFQRFNRRNSHISLPKERRILKQYIMLTELPTDYNNIEKTDFEIVSTDIDIYEMSRANKAENQLYYNAIEATSIEKLLDLESTETNKEIIPYVCAPTNETLFTRDFFADMQRPNLCQLDYEKKVVAKQIIIDGKEYYYTSPENIFVFNEKLGGYVELKHNSAEYKLISKGLIEN